MEEYMVLLIREDEKKLLAKLDATCVLSVFAPKIVVLPNEAIIAFNVQERPEVYEKPPYLRLFAWPDADAYCTVIQFFSLCLRAELLFEEQIRHILSLPEDVRLCDLGQSEEWPPITGIGWVTLAHFLNKYVVFQYSWACYDPRGPVPAHRTAEFYASGRVEYDESENRVAAAFQERQFVASVQEAPQEFAWYQELRGIRATQVKKNTKKV